MSNLDSFGLVTLATLLLWFLYSTWAPRPQADQLAKLPPTPVFVDYCHDGDTCRFLELEKPVRLARIDAAELDGLCPSLAAWQRDVVRGWLHDSRDIWVASDRIDPYDRWVGEVFFVPSVSASDSIAGIDDGDLVNLSSLLLQNQIVAPYPSGDSCLHTGLMEIPRQRGGLGYSGVQ